MSTIDTLLQALHIDVAANVSSLNHLFQLEGIANISILSSTLATVQAWALAIRPTETSPDVGEPHATAA